MTRLIIAYYGKNGEKEKLLFTNDYDSEASDLIPVNDDLFQIKDFQYHDIKLPSEFPLNTLLEKV